MEALEKLLDGDSCDQTGNKSTSASLQSVEWCASCQKRAKEVEKRYAGNFVAVKHKILFTDNLIQMYQTTKRQLEEMTDKCSQASKDKTLVQAQLELILSKDRPCFEETDTLREKVKTLESMVENLRTELHAMDESRRIHEESIKVLKAEDSGAVFELKKKHLQQMSELKKELSEKNDENKKLARKNKDLCDRLDRLRSAKRKQQSCTSVEKPVGSLNFINEFNQAMDAGKMEQDMEVMSLACSVEIHDKRAHVMKKNNSSDAEQEKFAYMDKSQESPYVSFTLKPSKNQLSDLLSMMKDWKARTCKRPVPKKLDAMNILLKKISDFCEKHNLKSHEDIVAVKLRDLYQHEIPNKKTRSWLQDVVIKLAGAKEVESSKASDPGATPPTPVSPVEILESLNAPAADTVASISDVVENLESRPENATVVDDFVSDMPDVSDSCFSENPKYVAKIMGDTNLNFQCDGENGSMHKTPQKSNAVIDKAKNHVPQTRRRTRSMRDGSSSEQDTDFSILSPPCRRGKIAAKQMHEVENEKSSELPTFSSKAVNNETILRTDCAKYSKSEILQNNSLLVVANRGLVKQPTESSHFLPLSTLAESVSAETPFRKDKMESCSIPSISSASDEMAGSDAGYDLNEIFKEMLTRKMPLTPFPQSPKPVLSEFADTALQSEGLKCKDSILPSTVLCTAINFPTPSKDGPFKNCSENSLEKKLLPEIQSKSRLRSASTDEIFASESSVKFRPDMFKPRRFSCEAPEMALSVRPIKPLSSIASFANVQFPLDQIEKTTYFAVESTRFPQNRKEKDIPSHWHATGLLKEFSSSSDGEGKSDIVFADGIAQKQTAPITEPVTDISMSSDYDTDDIIASMTILSSLVTGIETKLSGTYEAPPPVKASSTNDRRQEGVVESGIRESTDKNHTETAGENEATGTENIHCFKDIVKISSESCIGDEGLIMDVSDDASEPTYQKIVLENTKACKILNEKSPSGCPVQGLGQTSSPGNSTSITLYRTSLSYSATKDMTPGAAEELQNCSGIAELQKNLSETVMVTTFKDFKAACIKNAARKRKIDLKIEESFLVNSITNVLINTKVEFDLFKKCSEKSAAMFLDLPPCEQTFLKQIRVMMKSEMIDPQFLPKTVIPLMMKILRFGNEYSCQHNRADKSDELRHRMMQFLNKKARCRLGLPRLLALVRIFFFVCKMANVTMPIFALCHYHIMYRRAVALVVSILQGILCWPTVLKKYPEMGKAVICVLRRYVDTAQVVSNKKKAEFMKAQIDWIDRQCCWTTSLSDHTKPLDSEMIEFTMLKFESAAFSPEFLLFLKEQYNIPSSTLPIPVLDKETLIGTYIVELISVETFMEQIKIELLDQRFWPLLNKWSRHLHIHGDTGQNSEVSKATVIAILDAFAHILSSYLVRQRRQHPSQPTLPLMQSHYKVICDMMDNFSKPMYLNKAPRVVQCAVASFIIRTCFCAPSLSHTCLLKWVKASTTSPALQASTRHRDLSLLTALSGCDGLLLKRCCHWLDLKNVSPATNETLVKLLWGL